MKVNNGIFYVISSLPLNRCQKLRTLPSSCMKIDPINAYAKINTKRVVKLGLIIDVAVKRTKKKEYKPIVLIVDIIFKLV